MGEVVPLQKPLKYDELRRDELEATLAMKELAHREIGGMACTLYWNKKHNALAISLMDNLVNVAFVVDNDKGMDAFTHPYVYADERGLLPAVMEHRSQD